MTQDIDDDGLPPETPAAMITEPEKPKHKGGWPKGKPRRPDARSAALRSEAPRAGIRTRKRKGGQLLDKYAVSPELIPEGMSWEWKTATVYGKSDASYNAFLRDQGWEPVMAERYPGKFVDEGVRGPIMRDGLMLMERPMELTREAMAEERMAARAAVAIKEQQLHGAPDGQFPRQREDGSSTVRVSRTYERGGMEIDN
jgi:hypothetical protein